MSNTNNDSTHITQTQIRLDPNIPLDEFMDQYPELVQVLIEDYGFHCASCIFAGLDTLKEGAAIHGIDGEDFEDMIKHLELLINEDSQE